MALVNEHFLKLPGSYLFSDIAKKVNTFRITHPKQEVIRLGIGDVTRPLPPVCIEAMHKAVEEMADTRTFRGYGPEQGYDFLIEAIIKHDYLPRGIHFGPTEIFVNDGAKSDTGNIGDILRHDNSVGVTDPIYPVYIDSNVMCGRAGVLEENGQWSNVTYRERLHPGDSRQAHRHRLPLLPQQPHGHHPDQARAEEMGGLCARQRHADSVRCRLRSLHPRRRRAPLHL